MTGVEEIWKEQDQSTALQNTASAWLVSVSQLTQRSLVALSPEVLGYKLDFGSPNKLILNRQNDK